jgi:hypothetical protein
MPLCAPGSVLIAMNAIRKPKVLRKPALRVHFPSGSHSEAVGAQTDCPLLRC